MEARSASSITVDRLVLLFNTSFQGYISWNKDFTRETLLAWCHRSLVSLERSYIFYEPSSSCSSGSELITDPEDPMALALIAQREDRPGCVRLAAMGVALTAQGKGVGSRAIALIVQMERQRGTKSIELECVQSNDRGLKLYTRAGFETLRLLPGWERDAVGADDEKFKGADDLEECTVQEVDAIVKKDGGDDLPWQAGFVSKLTMANRAFKLGKAYCAISNPDEDEDVIKVATLIVEPEFRGQGQGTRLAMAMLDRFKDTGKKWHVHPIYPKEFSDGIAARVGAKEMVTGQVQMRKKL